MKAIHVIVTGRVQGVGFRYFTQHTAIEYNVTGWVKNKDDGSVELVAKGAESDVTKFLANIEEGPSLFAKVKDVHIKELNDPQDFQSFEIIY
ncbi:acylphosphatase [Gracilibacillus sp. YIM 98692]|uniref:acylphosphatase n=1 Tax=Gracilibacillus sp. YIM 98692 TaxID=2663532 RepID=UPI0013D2FF41|nr:acylphosphatase [Gracilibacillus sp. YIM 98692]